MVRLGLIGYPLGHSFSARYFTERFRSERIKGDYRLIPLPDPESLREFMADPAGLDGFNITIPYKETALAYMDTLSPEAREIGAVNMVEVERTAEGLRLKGRNTDAGAFRDTLAPLLQPGMTRALVLGTGGAAKAVAYALGELGIEPLFVSRNPERSSMQPAIGYADIDAEMMREHRLVINATPTGMAPHADECPPIPYEEAGSGHLFYDLIYNPEETEFLRRAREKGAATQNGLPMLHAQADAAWQIWCK